MVRINWNTVPDLHGQRAGLVDAIEAAVGRLSGEWSVSITESSDSTLWEVRLRSPTGDEHVFEFDGVEQQTPAYIRDTIAMALTRSQS